MNKRVLFGVMLLSLLLIIGCGKKEEEIKLVKYKIKISNERDILNFNYNIKCDSGYEKSFISGDVWTELNIPFNSTCKEKIYLYPDYYMINIDKYFNSLNDFNEILINNNKIADVGIEYDKSLLEGDNKKQFNLVVNNGVFELNSLCYRWSNGVIRVDDNYNLTSPPDYLLDNIDRCYEVNTIFNEGVYMFEFDYKTANLIDGDYIKAILIDDDENNLVELKDRGKEDIEIEFSN